MTSKDKCEALMEYIIEENQGYFDKERIGKDLSAILIDLAILDILKGLIEIIPNNATDAKSLLDIRIKPCHIIDDKILRGIKEWLDEKNE